MNTGNPTWTSTLGNAFGFANSLIDLISNSQKKGNIDNYLPNSATSATPGPVVPTSTPIATSSSSFGGINTNYLLIGLALLLIIKK